jgi:hypothetical protein
MQKKQMIEAAMNHEAIKHDFTEDEIKERVDTYFCSIDFTATNSPEAEVEHMIDNTNYFNIQ